MEELVKNAGLQPFPIGTREKKADDIIQLAAAYEDLGRNAAFKDYLYRLSQIRDATITDLTSFGGLDKAAEKRYNSQQAALQVVNTLLTYPQQIANAGNQAREAKQKMSDKGRRGLKALNT